jgi:hypothetical protein
MMNVVLIFSLFQLASIIPIAFYLIIIRLTKQQNFARATEKTRGLSSTVLQLGEIPVLSPEDTHSVTDCTDQWSSLNQGRSKKEDAKRMV